MCICNRVGTGLPGGAVHAGTIPHWVWGLLQGVHRCYRVWGLLQGVHRCFRVYTGVTGSTQHHCIHQGIPKTWGAVSPKCLNMNGITTRTTQKKKHMGINNC